MTIKIGLIGCGEQAVKHVGGLRLCPDLDIVLADQDSALARALAAAAGLASLDNPDDVFADPAIDAVDLCVPTPFRAPLIRRALAAGKDFFCDRPLCETLAEARDLHNLARRAGRIGMVGCVYRYAPMFQHARAILDGARETGISPVIGRIAAAMMRIGGRGPAAPWQHCCDEGGAAVSEMLAHMLDLAIWYFGPIVEAELMMHELLWPRQVIGGRRETVDAGDFVLARFCTRSGVPVVIQVDLATPAFSQMLEVQGDNGSLMVSIQPEMPQFAYAIRPAVGYPAGRTALGGAKVDPFEAQMMAFVAALRAGAPLADNTLADAVESMAALDRLSSADGPRPRRWR